MFPCVDFYNLNIVSLLLLLATCIYYIDVRVTEIAYKQKRRYMNFCLRTNKQYLVLLTGYNAFRNFKSSAQGKGVMHTDDFLIGVKPIDPDLLSGTRL